MISRAVLITGAAGGIGRATSLRFARENSIGLLLTDRDESGLKTIAAEARGEGAAVVTMTGDMVDAELPARLVEATLAAFGRLDTIISNAGTSRRGALLQQSLDNWDYIFAVNARATWLLAQASFPALASVKGSLVAVASIAGIEPNPGTGFYSASKAALLNLVAQLALEWSNEGVRINAVSPGVTLTNLNRSSYDDVALKTKREGFIPLRRFAEPEEIAGAIAFLASDAAAFFQGQNVVVDGGFVPAVLAHALPPITKR